jgi:hypothetical protein
LAALADYRPNTADFCPVAADSILRPTRHYAQLIYQLPQPITGQIQSIFAPLTLIRFGARPAVLPGRLPAKFNQFLPCRRRFTLSRTAFGSSLNRTEWGATNSLFNRVGETEYHIHEWWAK